MGPKGTQRAIEASIRREEREAQRRQRELERRAKEQAKLSTLEQARLEFDTYENQVAVLLSIHKEQGKNWDWVGVLASLPPPLPQRNSYSEFHAKQRLLVSRPGQQEAAEAEIERARMQDERIFQEALQSYLREIAEGERLRSLARRILDGEHKAYSEALSEFSALREISDLGSSIHFTVHHSKLLECMVNVNGQQAIPNEVKTLTATGKLSVKPMPSGRFQEIYADYVCGCVFRIAREVFALLPVDIVLITACAESIDARTGNPQEKPVLSVVMARSAVAKLDFERIDPSEAIDNFQHRFKATRKSEVFEAVTPLTSAEITHEEIENMALPAVMTRAQRAEEDLKLAVAELRRQSIVTIPEPTSIL